LTETYFNEHGFLADDVAAITQQIANDYGDWISLFRDINQTAVAAQYAVSIRRDAQALLTAALYSRVLSTAQGAVLLLLRGMPSQAEMLLRAATEGCFNLFAVANSTEFTDRYIAADEVERARFFRRTRRWQSPALRSMADDAGTEATLAEVEASVRALNARPIHVEEAVKTGGLHDWYLSVYASLCASVHTSVRNVQERHMRLDASGQLLELYNEPETCELHRSFAVASELLLMALRRFSQFCGIEYEAFEHAKMTMLHELCAREGLL
jgi:HrpA-like RNA helicase